MSTSYDDALEIVRKMYENRAYSLEQCLGNLGALEDEIAVLKDCIKEDIQSQQV